MSVLNEKLTNYLSVTLYIYKSRARLLSRGGTGYVYPPPVDMLIIGLTHFSDSLYIGIDSRAGIYRK